MDIEFVINVASVGKRKTALYVEAIAGSLKKYYQKVIKQFCQMIYDIEF